MKIVYVLVCSEKDFYYEQALVSVLSLRHVMPLAHVTLLIDDESYDYLQRAKNDFFNNINECKVVSFDKGTPGVKKSRYMKTKMRELLKGRLLYVDVDTVWAEPINEDDFDSDVMAEYDFNCVFSKNILKEWIVCQCKKASLLLKSDEYYNGGVMYYADSKVAYDFSKTWAKTWAESCKKGVLFDQPSLNYTNEKMGLVIKRMPSFYNVQLGFSLRYFCDAKIIHYFATDDEKKMFGNPYHFKQESFWENVKKVGISDDVLKDIYNPKQAFDNFFIMQNQEALNFIRNPLVGLLLDVIRSKKWYTRYIRKFLYCFVSLLSAKK